MRMVSELWAGVDEVGRGALAGPVVAAAVAWPEGAPPECHTQLRDSKRLTPARRRRLALALLAAPTVHIGLGWALPAEIDARNILAATLQAMARAVAAIPGLAGVRVDGNRSPELPGLVVETLVGGDDRDARIAAASIVAKVFRDRWLEDLASVHPGYGWERNKGYGSREHLEALARLGPSSWHRRSFAPVRQRSLFAP